MPLQSCSFHVYLGQILAPCFWESGSAFSAPDAWLRYCAVCAAALWAEVLLCRTRGFFSARDVFIQVMHACKSALCLIFLFQGAVVAGWRFLHSRVRKTSSNTRRGEAEEGLSRSAGWGRVARCLLLPSFWGPVSVLSCSRHCSLVWREREAPGKGRGEGGLVLPFESVCVGRGMIWSLAFHTVF